MEKPEKKERKEISERELKERRGRKPSSSSGVYDQHLSLRLGMEHIDMLGRIAKGKPKGEVIRDLIMFHGKQMEKAGKI